MIRQCLTAGVPIENIIDGGSVIYHLTEGKIYLDDDLPIKVKGGIFVDGGCYDGCDSKRYLEKYGGSVICFEPDCENIQKIRVRLKEYEGKYTVVNKALWSHDDVLSFNSNGTCGSRIGESPSGDTVFATSIDETVKENSISVIKMDIEGSEIEALHGTKNAILRNHPVLAISIYHKPEDIITIPEYIIRFSEDYRLYLRHYSFSWYDTVLYAIPR